MARAGIRGSRYRGISWREVAVQEVVTRYGAGRGGGGAPREKEGKTGASHRQLYFGREKRAMHKNMKKVRRRACVHAREWENNREKERETSGR